MTTWLRDAVLDALAVVSPVTCAGCGAPDRSVCAACRASLAPQVRIQTLPSGLAVHAALPYDGAVRRSILALKESNRTDVAGVLAVPLAAAVAQALAAAVRGPCAPELVAVPTSRSAWRRRGYDPVALLARRAGYRPVPLLEQGRKTLSQKTLREADRAANVHDSIRAIASATGRRLVLVDDVLTTGATLQEAARALADAGGEVVGAATLAFTPRLLPAGVPTLSRFI